MASASSGIDWSHLVKPLITASYLPVNKQDIPELVKAILKSKEELLQHEEQYEGFYSALCVLAADYLANHVQLLSIGGLPSTVSASKVLLQHLVDRVGCPAVTVTIPSSISSSHNHGCSHVSMHSGAATHLTTSTVATVAASSNKANMMATAATGVNITSVLSPTPSNIFSSSNQSIASLMQVGAIESVMNTGNDQTQSENQLENVISSLSGVPSLPITTIPSVVTTLPKEEKEKVVTVTDKHLVNAIKALCRGNGCLSRNDQSSLIAAIRSAKLPPNVRTQSHEKEPSSSLKDGRRNRSDPSAAIMEQLVSPLHDLAPLGGGSGGGFKGFQRHQLSSSPALAAMAVAEKEVEAAAAAAGISGGSEVADMRRLFGWRCSAALQAVGGGAVLLDVCLRLPAIDNMSRLYAALVQAPASPGASFAFPTTLAELQAFKAGLPQLLSELVIVARVLQLPVLEPLDTQRLEKLGALAMAGLLAALHVAAAAALAAVVGGGGKAACGVGVRGCDEEFETLGAAVAEKALLLLSIISRALCCSTRAGGHHFQNLQLMGAWLLGTGLHQIMVLVSTNTAATTTTSAAGTAATVAATTAITTAPTTAATTTDAATTTAAATAAAATITVAAATATTETISVTASTATAIIAPTTTPTTAMSATTPEATALSSTTLNEVATSAVTAASTTASTAVMEATPVAVVAFLDTEKNKLEKAKCLSGAKKESSQTRINLNKVQQGLNGVSVALATQWCVLLAGLLEDVAVEGWSPANPPPTPATLSILESHSATDRLARLFIAMPLTNLLFYLATAAYRKSCSLRRSQQRSSFHDGDSYSLTDSTIYCDDDFSEGSLGEEGILSQHSLSDSDSGSSLGVFIPTSKNTAHHHGGPAAAAQPPTIPDRTEPHGYLCLATRVFTLMTRHLVECESGFVQQHVRAGLADTHMIALAAIIRDMDRDAARGPSGGADASVVGGGGALVDSSLASQQQQFSHALYRYTHNVVASGLLSDSLQATLLQQLGVSPWGHDGEDWPLLLLPRTLTVLAQILLLRQRRDKDELKCDCDTACVVIWQRVVNTLVKAVLCSSSGSSSSQGQAAHQHDQEIHDLNVEHAQLLLFLFHALQLMQKKAVLLSVASALVTVAPVIKMPMKDSQLLHLARLLLIFDYLMKNLYEAPQALIEQVQWNLFRPISHESSRHCSTANVKNVTATPVNNTGTAGSATNNLTSSVGLNNGTASSATDGATAGGGGGLKMFHVWRDIEENYQKHCQDGGGGLTDDVVLKPRFYTLTPVDTNSQDTPKLDGLACSFILATPDTLKYTTLYETLVGLLGVTCQVDPTLGVEPTRSDSTSRSHSPKGEGCGQDGLSFLGQCAVQYTFSLVYRILLTLPPSVAALEALASPDTKLEGPWLLHALVWGPRASHKIFNGWIKDGLVRQSLTTQKADALLKSVTNVTSSLQHDLRVAGTVVTGLVAKIHTRTSAAPAVIGTGGVGTGGAADVASFADLMLVDAVLARLQVTLDDGWQRGELELRGSSDSHDLCQALKISADQLPVASLLSLIMMLTDAARHGVVLNMRELPGGIGKIGDVQQQVVESSPAVEACSHVLAISGDHGDLVRPCLTRDNRSAALNTALLSWTCNTLDSFPLPHAWKGGECGGDVLPGESFVSGVVLGHVASLSLKPDFTVASTTLKHVLRTLIAFTTDLASWYTETEKPHAQLVQTLVSIAADAICDDISSSLFSALDRLLPATPATESGHATSTLPPTALTAAAAAAANESGGSGSSSSSSSSGDSGAGGGGDGSSGAVVGTSGGGAAVAAAAGQLSVSHHLYGRLLVHVQALLKIAANYYGVIDERVLSGLGSFLCRLLESSAGKASLRSHFLNSPHFCSVLLSPVPPKSTMLLGLPLQQQQHKAAASKPSLWKPAGKNDSATRSVKAFSRASSVARESKEDTAPEATSKAALSDVHTNALPKPIVHFLSTLFQTAEKNSNDADLISICNHIWSWVDSGALQRWLSSALVQALPSSTTNTPPVIETPVQSTSLITTTSRKRKDKKSSKTKIVIANPFADPDLMPLGFVGASGTSGLVTTISSNSNMVTSICSKSKNNADAGDGAAADEQHDYAMEAQGVEDSADTSHRLAHSWKLLKSMTAYVCGQDGAVAKGQCVSLLRSLEAVGNCIVDSAVAAAAATPGTSDGDAAASADNITEAGNADRLLEPLTQLLPVMTSLAVGSGPHGHLSLFKTTTHWLEQCKEVVVRPDSSGTTAGPGTLASVQQLLEYMADVLVAVRPSSAGVKAAEREAAAATAGAGETAAEENTTDSDNWLEEHNNEEEEEEEAAQEDSDEDSMCNKLCTYTMTAKEFVNQHWYHCHTCLMEDGVGVCSVCAKVCHKGHDVTYAKYGSFFCDCGAKDDTSCQALVKRHPGYDKSSVAGPASAFTASTAAAAVPQHKSTASGGGSGGVQRSTVASSPTEDNPTPPRPDQPTRQRRALSKQIEVVAGSVRSVQQGVAGTVVQLLQALLPRLEDEAANRAAINTANTHRRALHILHTQPKSIEYSDQLMFATLGSQEGAFENVRLNYSGEQGQAIRPLVATHAIRRVAMCCLTSPTSRRQHLAVSHEKGKITLLQLSSLLRQQDPNAGTSSSTVASKRKLTITRLSSAPVPFTVLSINANPVNDDFLAVCGLKDAHVLVFSGSGSVTEHLVLHPHLESGSYIIKSVWLPGEQTQLALVTADFVKVYDLSVDSISPQYYLLLPSGKIRDACFAAMQDGSVHLILMTSSGYIYTQELNEDSSARHGPFYVTNVLAVHPRCQPDLKDVSGVVGGGGVAVYYSHGLQLLCFSYTHGRSFMAPLTNLGENAKIENVFAINVKASSSSSSSSGTAVGGSSNSSGSGSNGSSGSGGALSVSTTAVATAGATAGAGSASKMSPLCQWAEVQGHPGLFTCLMLHSNAPVVIFVQPTKITVQEMKIAPSKSKITDLVALRHTPATEARRTTSLILLCEDGSLKIFTANFALTDCWLGGSGGEGRELGGGGGGILALRSTRRKKPPKLGGRETGGGSGSGAAAVFPVDFFEQCTPFSGVEFGGSDLLQVYNVQQLKNRLTSQSTYVACSKPGGFQLEVVNKDPAVVVCGIRVEVGGLDAHKNPSFIEVFGRSVTVNAPRRRWYDLPLTRDEALQADKKLIITFGPSTDQSQVTIVDTVKVYGKNKEDFGWPDEVEEYNPSSGSATGAAATTVAEGGMNKCGNSGSSAGGSATGSVVECVFRAALDALDGCFSVMSGPPNSQHRHAAMDIVTRMISVQLAPDLQDSTLKLLSSLHGSRQSYHAQVDSAHLSTVVAGLNNLLAAGAAAGQPDAPTGVSDEVTSSEQQQQQQQQPPDKQTTAAADAPQMDCHGFHSLLLTARAVAVARPHNLVRFTEKPSEVDTTLVEHSTSDPSLSVDVKDYSSKPSGGEDCITTKLTSDLPASDEASKGASNKDEGASEGLVDAAEKLAEDERPAASTCGGAETVKDAAAAGEGAESASKHSNDTTDSDGTLESGGGGEEEHSNHFLNKLMTVFWMMLKARPLNPMLSPVYQPGLSHIESTVHAVIDIIHGYALSSATSVPLATKLYCTLLLSPDQQVSFSAKAALVRLLRPRTKKHKRVFLPSPPRCSTPGVAIDAKRGGGVNLHQAAPAVPAAAAVAAGPSRRRSQQPPAHNAGGGGVELLASMMELGAGGGADGGGGGGDDDDDAMMELAIALSLHDEASGGHPMPGMERLQHLRGQVLHSLLAAGALQPPPGVPAQHHHNPHNEDDDDDAEDEAENDHDDDDEDDEHEVEDDDDDDEDDDDDDDDIDDPMDAAIHSMNGGGGGGSGLAADNISAAIHNIAGGSMSRDLDHDDIVDVSADMAGADHLADHLVDQLAADGSGMVGEDNQGGQFSDTTASANGSDDEDGEVSNAATDGGGSGGNLMRVSSHDQGCSGGSESGGSVVESLVGEPSGLNGGSGAGPSTAGGASDGTPHSQATPGGGGDDEDATTAPRPNSATSQQDTAQHQDCEEGSGTAGVGVHGLRLALLDALTVRMPTLPALGGHTAIPCVQVILMLSTDLDPRNSRDRQTLDALLSALVATLDLNQQPQRRRRRPSPAEDAGDAAATAASGAAVDEDVAPFHERTPEREVQLLVMRLLSVLMSRSKTAASTTTVTRSGVTAPSAGATLLLPQLTANCLVAAGALAHCLTTLRQMLDYWRAEAVDAAAAAGAGTLIGSVLLKARPTRPVPDMSPFFMRPYGSKSGASQDVFSTFPLLLTEMVLRLPYQVHKVCDRGSSSSSSSGGAAASSSSGGTGGGSGGAGGSSSGVLAVSSWCHYLCEYTLVQQQPAVVRRQVRKLLLALTGHKDKYRCIRDLHALDHHIKEVKVLCAAGGLSFSGGGGGGASGGPVALPYDALIQLIEHLKACVDIAQLRTHNWQKYCLKEESVVSFLVEVACLLDEGVAPTILQLLQAALCPSSDAAAAPVPTKATAVAGAGSSSLSRASSSSKRASSEDSEAGVDGKATEPHVHWPQLVAQVHMYLDRHRLGEFIHTFLLVSNSTTVRWQAHRLVLALYRHSAARDQDALLSLMWALWPRLPMYGRRAAQFVDLLGYFSLNTSQQDKVAEYMDRAVCVLRTQSQLLASHPNASLYNALASLVHFDGYYLESEPCLVCNNPEVPFSTAKLATIKADSKYTTTTQLVKLASNQLISRISLRVADLKRAKMVRTLNIYYNNRSVQSVVELKNKPSMWHKAKKVSLAIGQTEVKIDFLLPIAACNLMFEYADFYENMQASSETLQCPRCSAGVPASPGVCANCGENVYQCHKCRAINYDEKDPFLCTACGYCKYAKFDYSLQCRLCCAVDPIDSEEDRKKGSLLINLMLEKADTSYKQLQAYKPALEGLLLKVVEHGGERGLEDVMGPAGGAGGGSNPLVGAGGSSMVNRTIQLLAQKYCSECKGAFDALSKLIQRIQACRRELVAFDRSQKDGSKKQVVSPLLPSALSSPDSAVAAAAAISFTSAANTGGGGRCYGCASAATQHCITLLRALATRPPLRSALCSHGLMHDLLQHNLRRGNVQVRNEVRELLVLLTEDDHRATEELNELLSARIRSALTSSSHLSSPDLAVAVRHEVALLAAAARKQDQCWETRLRCVAQLFLLAGGTNSTPEIMEHISLPCLRILQQAMTPPPTKTAAIKAAAAKPVITTTKTSSGLPPRKPRTDKTSASVAEEILVVKTPVVPTAGRPQATTSAVMSGQYEKGCRVGVDLHKWLTEDPKHSFEAWRKRAKIQTTATSQDKAAPAPKLLSKMTKSEVRQFYLMEKYACRWVCRSIRWQFQVSLSTGGDGGSGGGSMISEASAEAEAPPPSWLKQMLFNPSSRMARQVAAQVVFSLAFTSTTWRAKLLDMLTSYLPDISCAGESAEQFVNLYKTLIGELEWKHYLAVRGALTALGNLITREIQQLTTLEETSVNTDMLQGYALKTVTELLQVFLDEAGIKSVYKGQLLSPVLSGYLNLRKLVVQRTKHVDDTQDKLLDMLEDMTSGTEDETLRFMAVCVATLQRYPADDLRTPVFLFERLCSIIHPEENDIEEFFMMLEKDPQQEDFLQGRMNSNPYSSDDSGMGPRMRDIKNKICQDCELVALLEDDSGMELLVANKIISLDLAVKDVYKICWLAENPESPDMRIVYRMRGLMGDATEEFVETLDKKKDDDVDKEQVYRMAAVMSECGGLRVMLDCLLRVSDLSHARPLVTVLLKLFQLCVKLRVNRSQLLVPSMGAVTVLLHTLKQCLAAEPEVVAGPPEQPTLTEQLLMVLESVLVEACEMPAADYAEFVETCGTLEDIHLLLNYVATSSRTNAQVKQRLMRVLPFLVFCHKEKMELLVGHFRPVLDFDFFDIDHSPEDTAKMESFCVFCSGIERNEIGSQLKDMILRANIVKDALSYLERHLPRSKKVVVVCGDDEWKEFLARPALKYILRLLTGLSCKHQGTQRAVAASCVPAIHRLEQISSDEHVGTLAENLLEALRDDPEIATQVGEVRRQTRQEKKRLAMKTRCKELSRLGLRANDKEQITSKSALLQHHISDITEEQGLVCAICLEGYRSAPQKVLAIYTYSKRRAVEDREGKPHKTLGYCTVSHFNVVHVECHLAAVKATRSRDEWDSAALHNANTLANGLLPLWGPQVPEAAFASCLARHHTYLQEYTGHRDINYTWTLHDVKLLLIRFARERSFSEDSGGGGPQSNINLLPYVLHMALYVINTTGASKSKERRVESFIEQTSKEASRWVESSYEVEGPYFLATLALAVCSSDCWAASLRLEFLKRLLATAHVRAVSAVLPHQGKITAKQPKDWSVYKSAAIFWALIDNLYTVMFKGVCSSNSGGSGSGGASGGGDWSVALAEFIRNNDVSLLEASTKILSTYQNGLLPCTSFSEFCDVTGLVEKLDGSPDNFLANILDALP